MKDKKKPLKDEKYLRKRQELDDEITDLNPEEKQRTELDHIVEGDDMIEMEENTERQFEEALDYAPKDGDLAADNATDLGDLPPELRKQGNHYEPGLTAGYTGRREKDELERGIRPEGEREAGAAYDEDDYTEEWEEEKEGGKKVSRKSRYENK